MKRLRSQERTERKYLTNSYEQATHGVRRRVRQSTAAQGLFATMGIGIGLLTYVGLTHTSDTALRGDAIQSSDKLHDETVLEAAGVAILAVATGASMEKNSAKRTLHNIQQGYRHGVGMTDAEIRAHQPNPEAPAWRRADRVCLPETARTLGSTLFFAASGATGAFAGLSLPILLEGMPPEVASDAALMTLLAAGTGMMGAGLNASAISDEARNVQYDIRSTQASHGAVTGT